MTLHRAPTHIDPLTLKFLDNSVENAFWERFALTLRTDVRVGMITLTLLFVAFGWVDQIAWPDDIEVLWGIRYGIVVPLLLASTILVLRDRGYQRIGSRVQEFLAVQGIVTMGGLAAFSPILWRRLTLPQLQVGALGIMLSLMVLYGVSRMRWAYAVPLGVLLTGLALVVGSSGDAVNPGLMAVVAVFSAAVNATGAWISRSRERLAREAFVADLSLAQARERSHTLLRTVLPASVADNLDSDWSESADVRATLSTHHDAVTVVLADLVGFTALSERLSPMELAGLLDRVFSEWDALCHKHGVEKIKTLGDAWLAVSGAPIARPDHAEAGARLALDMLATVDLLREQEGFPLSLRIGIHTGPAEAGVIGHSRFAWDVWGDAVEGAARQEAASRPGHIRASSAHADALMRHQPSFVRVTPSDDTHDVWLWPAPPRASPTLANRSHP